MRLADFVDDRALAARAEILAYRLLFGPEALNFDTVPYGYRFGILGVGLHAERQAPLLFVTTNLLPAGEIGDANRIEPTASALQAISQEEKAWYDVLAVGTPSPVQNISTRDIIRGRTLGTAGAPVEWTSPTGPKFGILTAGHVVGNAQAVYDRSGRTQLGTVAQCVLPGANGIDVALIETPARSPSQRLSGPAGITGATRIELLKAGAVAHDNVVAKAGWFYWAAYTATYVDLYVTNTCISQPGDSGSVAVIEHTDYVVGSLVGSSTGSLIQDARTQLGAFPSFNGLKF